MADPAALRLGWMIAALATTLLPMLGRLPAWITLAFVAAALWRQAATRGGWKLPGRWLRTSLAVTLVAGVLLSYRTFNGLEAGSGLLVAMASMKLLETRARRDVQVLAFIGYFLILSQLLYDQSVWTLPWLVGAVAFITLALLQGVRHGMPLPAREAAGLVARMLAFAVPVALVLFLLFPRVPGPFWALPSRGPAGTTGLDDEMSPGTVTRLIQSDEVAFRVNFEGAVPPPGELYWRGPVLERFDGITWRDGERFPVLSPEIDPRGTAYRYRMVIEPNGRPWLLALDYPAAWSERDVFVTHEFQLLSRRPLESTRALEIVSFPAAAPESALGPGARARLVRLPQGRNPRTVALARELRQAARSDAAFVDAVLARFRDEPFVYTLAPPALSGGHPVDEFLFRTRRGFCEHYASAFTVLARAAGIPARVVTGYQGGAINPLSERLVVRQSDAHAWAEVWLEGRGWARVDPTGAVAPERIELGLEDALPEGEALPGAFLRGLPLMARLEMSWDALNAVWTDWVLGFDRDSQSSLLARLGLHGADWGVLVLGLTGLVTLIMATLSGWLAWRGRPPRRDASLVLYERFCARMAAAGLARQPTEGPFDYARRVAAARPDLGPVVNALTRRYMDLRYGPEPNDQALARLARLVRAVRP